VVPDILLRAVHLLPTHYLVLTRYQIILGADCPKRIVSTEFAGSFPRDPASSAAQRLRTVTAT
jgi:hypothetical protein